MKKTIIPLILGAFLFLLSPIKITQAEELSSLTNPSFQIENPNTIFSTLYAVFPDVVFEQSIGMTEVYIWDPNTRYQDVMGFVDQNLYWHITRFLEPHINQFVVHHSLGFAIPTPLTSPQAFLSLQRDEVGILTYLHYSAVSSYFHSEWY